MSTAAILRILLIAVLISSGMLLAQSNPQKNKSKSINLPNLDCAFPSAKNQLQTKRPKTVTGTVIDLNNNEPLEEVIVMLLDSLNSVRDIRRTNAAGQFILKEIFLRKFKIKTYRFGYVSTLSGPYDLSARDTLRMLIKLEATPIPLDEVTVTSTARIPYLDRVNYYWRKENLSGKFIVRQDFAFRGLSRASDIFRDVPGLVVRGENIYFARYISASLNQINPSPLIYVDDLLLNVAGSSQPVSTLSWLSPDDILGIEVYSSANAPIRYSRGIARGVILIWTRDHVP